MGSECTVAPAHAGKCLKEELGTVSDLDKGVERTAQRKSKKKRRNKRKKGKCGDATPPSAPLHLTQLRSPEVPALSTSSPPKEAELSLVGTDSNENAQDRVSRETQRWGSQADFETMQAGDTATAGSVDERGDSSLPWDDSQVVYLHAPPPMPDANRSSDQAEDRNSTSTQEEGLLRVSEAQSAFGTRSNHEGKGDRMSVKRF